MRQTDERSRTAYHEAGHALATVLAYRDAKWLLKPRPRCPVRHVAITDSGSGSCHTNNLYSTRQHALVRLAPRLQPLISAQISVEVAGGAAEAIYCGAAWQDCGTEGDLRRAAAMLQDLSRSTGSRHDLQTFVEQAGAMLREHWAEVEALARALIELGRVDGERVQAIVAQARKQRTAEERDLTKTWERLEGRRLTEQEANLAIDQARAIGEL